MIRNLLTLAMLLNVAGIIQAATPTIESIALGVGQRGTEFTLKIVGARLSNPQEILFYGSGLRCNKLTATSENEVTAMLQANSDCKLGEHPFRLRTVGGVSELRTIIVTPFPVVEEKEPNDELKQAQSISANVSIAAIMESGGLDHYRIKLRKGERLAAEVVGIRLGAELSDTVLTVFGPDGKELVTVDDTPLFHQDPFVNLLAPFDGEYTVQVWDTNFGGSDTNRYLLHLGMFTRPAAIYPTGGETGKEVSVKLLGDALSDRTETVKLPANGGRFHYFPSDGQVPAPTEMPFRVSPFPNVLEVEPNDEHKQATPSPTGWPVAFNGIIDKPGEVDHFRFAARKGDQIEVNTFAYRVGSPLDSVVSILTSSGELLARGDDGETHDTQFRVTIPSDSEYLIRVEDKRKQGGPLFTYRVEIDRPKPALEIFLPLASRKSHSGEVIAVPRGNRIQAFLGVRRDGFTGPVSISPLDLPKGVKLNVSTIPANEYLVPITIEASSDAPLGGGLIRLSGNSTQATPPVSGEFTQFVRLIHGPGDSTLQAVTVSKLALVVIEESPFTLSVEKPKTSLPVDGTLDLFLRIKRSEGFNEAVEVGFPSLPPGVETPKSVLIPADKSEAVVKLTAQRDADVGNWLMVAEGRLGRPARPPRGDGMGMGMLRERPSRATSETVTPVSSEVVEIETIESPIRGTFLPAGVEQGKNVKVILRLDTPLPEHSLFTAKLDGLPPRATAPPIQLMKNAKEVEFQVAVEPTSPVGTHASLIAELSGMVDGQRVVYRVGRVGTLRIDAIGGVKTDASGKPLSPLEALRLEEKMKK